MLDIHNRLYSIQEAANILGVSTKTLRRWDQRGRFVATRTAGNQRRYTQAQIDKFRSSIKNAAEVPQLFSENEAPKELKITHSFPSALSGLPSGSFLKNHFLLKHASSINESISSSENLEKPFVPARQQPSLTRRPLARLNPLKMGLVFASLVLFVSLAGAIILVKYNAAAGLPRLTAGLFQDPSQSSGQARELSFVPPDLVGSVLAAAAGGSDLALNINVPTFFSQNIGIGTTTPDTSAILDLTSEDQGFLAPRMTTVQRDAIASPATGLFVYNTDTNHYNMYNGTSWEPVGTVTAVGDVTTGEAFTETGISGTALYFYDADGRGKLTTANLGGVRTYTLPDASGEVSLLGQTIGNSELVNSKVTVSAGTNMTGGGEVSLGSSITLTLKDSISLAGTLTTSGATALNGNVTLGDAITDTITFTGRVAEDSDLIPIGTTGTNDLGSTSLPWDNLYANNVIAGGTSGIFGWLQRNSNAISPTNISDDLLLGATSTSSAKFGFLNVAGGTPTASISANSGNNATTLTGTGVLGTTNMQTLTLGNSTTGNIVIDSGSSAITLSDATTLSSTLTVSGTTTLNGIANIGDGGDNVVINSDVWDITGAGAASGLTGISSSGTVTFTGLTASRALFTDASSNLAATGVSSALLNALTDETGTGVAVFGTAPTFTTSITDPLVIGGTGTTSTLTLRSTSGVGATGADIIFQVGNNGGTEAVRILNDGNVGIGTTAPLTLLDVRGGASASGALTLTTTPTIQSTAMQNIIIGGTATGGIGLSPASATPSLFVMNGGNVGIGTVAPTTFRLEVAGIIGPTVGSTHDIGSSARRWATVYGDTGNFTNISGTVTGGATISSDWLINSDNATEDTEDATLTFERGAPTTNSQFRWNATTKQISTNSPSFAILPDSTIAFSGTAALIVNQVQAQDIFTASASGTTRFTVGNSGDTTIVGDLAVNGATSADITSTTTTGTLFNATVTTISLGGAATTLNLGTTDSVTRTINLGTGTGADTINIGTGATTANTVNVGTGAVANTIAIGSSSTTGLSLTDDNWSVTTAGLITTADDAAINGGDITTSATTFNLVNATATTVNFAQAATTLTMGATTGTATIRNATVDFSGGSATVSGNLTLYGAARTIQTTALNTLTIGGTTTGFIVIDSGSGVVNLPDLTASRVVFTDASSNLAATGASSALLNALTDETGTGVAVFGTSPDITTSLTTGSTTFALVNATATTVNFAQAATTLTMGATTGTATIRNATVDFSGGSATVSGNLTLYGAARTIQTTALNTLTIGGTTTGFIVIDSGSGVVNLPDLTASRALFTDASSNLVATGVSASLRVSLTDETGTGVAVFGTAPTFASTITIGTAGGTTGAINLRGTTSGAVTVTTAAAAGTYTLTLPTDDGTAGQVLETDGAGILSWGADAGTVTFTRHITSATHTKATGITVVVIHVIGGGGGGAGGEAGWAAGGGGGGGAMNTRVYNAADVPTSLTITIGDAGTAGAGNGAGGAGGNTEVTGGDVFVRAFGGGGGGNPGTSIAGSGGGGGGGTVSAGATGGVTTGGTGGNPRVTEAGQVNQIGGGGATGGNDDTAGSNTEWGGSGGGGGGSSAVGGAGGSSLYGAGAGGGGGDALNAGGAGGAHGSYAAGGGGAGGAAGVSGGAGGAGTAGTARPGGAGDGGGGGGGSDAGGSSGGAGGAGGVPGGGGGGGGSADAAAGGGAGARGEVRIWEW